jgi:hypothetical protein
MRVLAVITKPDLIDKILNLARSCHGQLIGNQY